MFLAAAFWLAPICTFAAPSLTAISGVDVISGKELRVPIGDKTSVVVFLSAHCPCSNSHVGHLNDLAKKYPKIQFVGINANQNETLEEATKYFSDKNMNFPVVRDEGAQLADTLGALKTPHVFVFDQDNKLRFRGGVTSSNVFNKAEQKHLQNFLAHLAQKKAPEFTEARALGCYLKR